MTAACSSAPDEPRQFLPAPANPSFTLFVSNQSFDLPAIDIRVAIDGRRAVGGTFHVEGQHTWIPFDFGFTPGKHTISVTSADTEATLSREIDLGARNWGVLSFWYYPTGSPEPVPERFTLEVLDEEPAFQ